MQSHNHLMTSLYFDWSNIWMLYFTCIGVFLSVLLLSDRCGSCCRPHGVAVGRSNEPPLGVGLRAPAGRLSGSEVDFERLTLIEPLTPRRRRTHGFPACFCAAAAFLSAFHLMSSVHLSLRPVINKILQPGRDTNKHKIFTG